MDPTNALATNALTNALATNSISPGALAAFAGVGIFIWLIIFVMYFLPTVIAVLRKHRQLPAIAAVNILLGWTVIGWIAAFIWSLMSPQAPQVIVVQNGQPPAPPPA